ncbi:hypothetical protein [Rugosimonospora africana]|uniref:Uncharacterized protein n=1 Tax=Rugosimonospora africana TaxID=556532 RepID=A0A8J3VR33_9ACTN|nr:hypothetical protein [Rugosimonospora africana]GIH14983.1 hypothetical protein Raf01_31550 [Rugosimonospora africana]
MDASMKELEQLAVLDPARERVPTDMEWARSRAFVERVMAGEVSSRPAHRPVGRWLGVGAAAVAAGVVAAAVVPALLPGAADKAVASWTAAPSSLTGEQVLPQAQACARNDVGGSASAVRPADVLLAEKRGDATLLIMRKSGGNTLECLSVGDDQFASMGLTGDRPLPAPPAGTVSLETMSSTGSGDSMWSNIVGLVGPGVTGVDVRLDDGRVFQTSVKAGWWAAWWPGPEGGEVDHLTVLVHTSAGTTSYRPSELP